MDYAAVYTADSWFRAFILNIDKEKGEVEVYYVDYGNTEKISMLILFIYLSNLIKRCEFFPLSELSSKESS